MAKPSRPRFFKPVPATARAARELVLTITRLSDEGRGVAFSEGKRWFVSGALPGETVRVRVQAEKREYAQAELLAIEVAAPARISPRCPLFGRCGGCQLQMLDHAAQLAHKRQALERLLAPLLSEGQACPWQEPLVAESWHYRHRARLSVGEQGGAPLLGFKAANSHRLVPVSHCDVLDRRLQPLLSLLPQWLLQLKQWRRIEEIRIVVDSDGAVAVDWQGKGPLPAADRERLQQLCAAENIRVGGAAMLTYRVPSQQTAFTFTPRDFTQINPAINDQLVAGALAWLQPQDDSRVIDLFCGLGNFTVPLSRVAAEVTGVEGSTAMVERARGNALAQQRDSIRFIPADLFEPQPALLQGFDRALLDPPRAGAQLLCEALAAAVEIQRIVYVSCNPQTLARDLKPLVAGGFRIERVALVEMFPQSGHSEAMVCLQRI